MTGLVKEVLPEDGLDDHGRDSVTIMTGMTYDDGGQPVDYLKQVFASFELAEAFSWEGYHPEVYLLVADNFVKMNQDADGLTDEAVRRYAERRSAYLQAVADLFSKGYDVMVESTSDVKDAEYRRIVERLGDRVEQDDAFASVLTEPVPEDRLDPDESTREQTEYTREELATILKLGTDVKVGPKREKLYDMPARSEEVRQVSEQAAPVVGVYVSNTLPTNLPDDETDAFREKGGVTPYKARSKGLDPEKHRFLISDRGADIERKLDGAPGEVVHDLESLNAFMAQRGGDTHPELVQSLAQNFKRVEERV